MRDEVVDTLLALLSMDSDLHSDMNPIVSYARRRLEKAGMKVRIFGNTKYPALLATYGEDGMLFSGHLDTVPKGTGWVHGQGDEEDNLIYGRGTVDMKGFDAAAIEAAEDLVKEKVPFSIGFTTDEEEQMYSTAELVKEEAVRRARGIVIGEPTGLCPAYREKGVFRCRLTTTGRAAHASQPWLGDDAILKMHSCLSRLQDLAIASRQGSTAMTMCFSTIQGGTKNNVVADRCTTEIDVRFPLPQRSKEVHQIVADRLEGLDFDLDVEYTIEAFESDPGAELSAELSRFLGTEPIVVPYATEAPKFAAFNPQVCICGPGEPTQAHTIDEHVNVDDLLRAYDMIMHIARHGQG
jgi:acetylornithine deacetylase/succinyl-diaminopimelate desuccinylase-like protein